MPALPRRLWAEMSTTDFASADMGKVIAVLPVAAIEQHGPHLPVGTDTFIAEGHLARVLPLLPDDLPVLFLPVQAIGKSNEHTRFPGTLTLTAETAQRAWFEIGESVHRAGCRKLVIVNAHGGNVPVIDIVCRELRVRLGMLAVSCAWGRFGHPDGLYPADEVLHGIHGGDYETSLMLAFRPDTVRMGKAQDFAPLTKRMEQEMAILRAIQPAGFGWMAQDINPAGAVGNAAAATAEKGARSAEHGARAFVTLLQDVHRFEPTWFEAGGKAP
jgi:creatinine amidohydrolase